MYNSLFQSHKTFFNLHQTKDTHFRKKNLIELKKLLKENETLLYDAIYADFHKSTFETFLTELGLVYRELDFFIKNIMKLSKPRKVKTDFSLLPAKSYIYTEPLGITLIIGAWNYPFYLTLIPLINAMAAGNTCIIKPSELAPHSSSILWKLINQHFPEHYIHVVEGGATETTELLKLKFDKIFFTGSPRVGKIVYETAAKQLIPVTLELGGKSPVIVTESADLKVTAKRIVWGKFLNAGQTCIAPDYLLIHKTVKNELLNLMTKLLKEIDYKDNAEHYVSIINKSHYERLLELLKNQNIYYGGDYKSSTRYIQPTILDEVKWDNPIMQDEIFGPILPVISYTNYDRALAYIQEQEKPLAAYLFSKSKHEEQKFLKQLTFGGGCINDTIVHVSSKSMPFGGVGNSGIGNYHGKYGFLTFSHQKSIIKKANWGEPNFKYPPYTSSKKKWIKRFLG